MSIRTTNGSILRLGWKVALDITCVLLALPIWLPVIILLMLVTRIASPGPIFYRQERVGLRKTFFYLEVQNHESEC
jgi:lipopolysaccharide/colanic/teichoic acid biosynthesis glycosyltransferase